MLLLEPAVAPNLEDGLELFMVHRLLPGVLEAGRRRGAPAFPDAKGARGEVALSGPLWL